MGDKHFCVIGAGVCGLMSIKSSLEVGARVTCLERTGDIGGLWRYTNEVTKKASVSKSTVINTSKEFSAFSDFPPPADYPNFMRHDMMLKYFRMYAEEFDLLRHIKFHTEVTSVDFGSSSGTWTVIYKNVKTGEEKTETFDGVLVCTGHHAEPNMPKIEGLDRFKGTVIHTHDYKTMDRFVDKNVLIVGIGNSGGDCAVELCRFAKSLHMSTRRGTWCFPRSQPNGMPIDLSFNRFNSSMMGYLPLWLTDWMLENVLIKTDHDLLGLRPGYGPTAQHGMANDDFPNRILSGLIKISPDVKCFGPNSVTFVDGTEVKDLDAVILATGYVFGFPFLSPKILTVDANKVDLYKLIFPPHMSHSTLAVIGCIQPHGSTISISELQTRWATRVLSGIQKLPSEKDMMAEIQERRRIMSLRYVDSIRHTIQVDAIPYMDSLAAEIGCMPNISRLLMNCDYKLAFACLFGPAVPYQYRLHGPNAWSEAREIILTVDERVRQPLRTHISEFYGSTKKPEKSKKTN